MSLCAYEYPDWGGEYAEVWREGIVQARKEHTCCECSAVIQPGERYGQATAISRAEGLEVYRRCPACLILAELVATLTEYCPLWGALDIEVDGLDLPSPHEHRQQWEAAGSPPPPEPTPEAHP